LLHLLLQLFVRVMRDRDSKRAAAVFRRHIPPCGRRLYAPRL